jgi:hypothetical protein
MFLIVASTIGVIIGALEGAMIFFVPEEPHKVGVFMGAAIKGSLNGLLVGLSVSGGSTWWQGTGLGLLYGFLLGLVIVLPEGGFHAKDAKYIMPFSVIGGGLIGLLAVMFR